VPCWCPVSEIKAAEFLKSQGLYQMLLFAFDTALSSSGTPSGKYEKSLHGRKNGAHRRSVWVKYGLFGEKIFKNVVF
jgi:hypothetical protein